MPEKKRLNVDQISFEDLPNLRKALNKQIGGRFRSLDFTTDYPMLQKRERHFVFVYGTLKKGHRNHESFLGDAELVGCGYTKIAMYRMQLVNTNRPYPVATIASRYEQQTDKAAKIYGEIYAVDPIHIRDLDLLENNGEMFLRTSVYVDAATPNNAGEVTHEIMRCFTYIGLHSFWESNKGLLSDLPMLHSNQNKQFKYYTFMRHHENPKAKAAH